MNSRSYVIQGTKIIISDSDNNAEAAATQLASSIKAEIQIRAIATNPSAVDYLEKYATNGEKLAKANSLLRETLNTQETVLKFITNLDVDNTVKASIPAVKKFRELKSLLDSIVFPEINDNLKKILTPSMISATDKLSTQKADILKSFQTCVKVNTTIEESAKVALANRKANTLAAKAKASAQVQPNPPANANQPSNPAAFMYSNNSSAEAAKAGVKPGVKPGVQPVSPNQSKPKST